MKHYSNLDLVRFSVDSLSTEPLDEQTGEERTRSHAPSCEATMRITVRGSTEAVRRFIEERRGEAWETELPTFGSYTGVPIRLPAVPSWAAHIIRMAWECDRTSVNGNQSWIEEQLSTWLDGLTNAQQEAVGIPTQSWAEEWGLATESGKP